MPLTPQQVVELRDVILLGFKRSELDQLVDETLRTRLDIIVERGDFEYEVYQLIKWAEARGKTRALIDAVANSRPHNNTIQAVAKILLVAAAADEIVVVPPTAPKKKRRSL